MNLTRIIIVLIAILSAYFISLSGGFMTEEVISIGLFVYFLLNFVDSIGKSFNPLDITILLALFQCLMMPIVVFHVYNDNQLVIALKYDMGVTAERYYGFIFPAVLALIAGIKLIPLFQVSYQKRIHETIKRAEIYLQGKGSIGVLFIIVGFVAGVMTLFIPADLGYVVYLFEKLLYVGVLYIYFSDFKSKGLYLGIAFFVIFSKSLLTGMFGELVYILAMGSMMVLLGKKISNGLKFGLAAVGFIFLLLVQSVKSEYRQYAWSGKGSGFGLYMDLLKEHITQPELYLDETYLFPIVNRANQGMIIGKVMDYIPARAPYAGGETVFKTVAASFVPRLLWPDKPISGGKYNMERFTGFIIEGYSMNISPLGEAYGNFGVDGGVVFMFFYGLFFSVIISMLLFFAKKRPTVLLWLPILFLNAVQMETDILMCVNSLLKGLIFIWFCYWAADRFLRLKL